MDKTPPQPHQQRVDPLPCTPTPSSEPSSPSSGSESSQAASAPNSSEDAGPMEPPILAGLSFQQQLQESSPSSAFGNAWSTGSANAVDDALFQGIPPVNGTMLFQNFPHPVNPVFGGTFSPQLGLASQTAQQRRSPASPSQGPFPQRHAYQTVVNSSKGPAPTGASSASNNHQNAAWSTASNPWSGLQTGRDPRRAVGVGVGVGVGVPSPLNPISPMKKPYSSSVIALPKFPRAGALTPKPWPEDGAFRTDNTNNILPFQVGVSSPNPAFFASPQRSIHVTVYKSRLLPKCVAHTHFFSH